MYSINNRVLCKTYTTSHYYGVLNQSDTNVIIHKIKYTFLVIFCTLSVVTEKVDAWTDK